MSHGNVLYICNKCKKDRPRKNCIENKLNLLSKKVDEIAEKIVNVKTNEGEAESNKTNRDQVPGGGYASALKKNLLVVKSSTPGTKILEKKKQISNALRGIPKANTSVSSSEENMTLNFHSAADRDRAAAILQEQVSDTVARSVSKLKPKITICNVNKLEDKDEIVSTLIENNAYLQAIDNVQEKIKVVFWREAAFSTINYIVRCEPEVRNAIQNNGDIVYLEWARYKVRDRYHVLTCYHCQHYGHKAQDCKEKDKVAKCAICAGDHDTRACQHGNDSAKHSCINCIRQSRPETGHKVNAKCCLSLEAQVKKLASKTDNGN